jgi:hypothetical protein
MFDSRNEKELEQVHKAGWDIMEICAEFGGTISGEHGIGEEKREAMKMVFSGHDLNTQQRVKSAFDPKNLLNPTKIIPLPPEGADKLPDSPPTVLKRLGGAEAAGVAEAMDAVRAALAENKAIRIAGTGTFNGLGNPLTKESVVIDSLKMTEFIEYDQDNQFITVGSGVTLAALQEKLGQQNQWLPLRPPFGTTATTIGSIVATAEVGPERLAYSAPRDMLLGLQYIDSSGSMVSAGGKVVKNVAGYDMTRLLTGSMGTLGFITEATWKIATRPEICKQLSGSGSLEACFEAGLKIVNSNLLAALVTIKPEAGQATLQVGFEGLGLVVDSQIERCAEVMKGSEGTSAVQLSTRRPSAASGSKRRNRSHATASIAARSVSPRATARADSRCAPVTTAAAKTGLPGSAISSAASFSAVAPDWLSQSLTATRRPSVSASVVARSSRRTISAER